MLNVTSVIKLSICTWCKKDMTVSNSIEGLPNSDVCQNFVLIHTYMDK